MFTKNKKLKNFAWYLDKASLKPIVVVYGF